MNIKERIEEVLNDIFKAVGSCKSCKYNHSCKNTLYCTYCSEYEPKEKE